MKTTTLLISGLIGLASCSQQDCKIEGTVENANDGDTLLLARLAGGEFVPSDTIVLRQGKFSLKEKCDSTIIACFLYKDRKSGEAYSDFFFMDKGEVRLDIGRESKAAGTENNDIYQQIKDSLRAVDRRMRELYSAQLPSDSAAQGDSVETARELERLEKQRNQFVTESVKKHIGNPVGYFLFVFNHSMFSPQETIELAGKVAPDYKDSKTLKKIVETAEKNLKTSKGQPFTDITVPAMGGGELKLSDIVKEHKLTLVDCWASWCGPCRAEMPNVVALYGKYHKKGLEIVGISFDEDETAWKDAVKEMKMTWPQASELHSWDNVMTHEYGVTSIPHTILIDGKGIIVDRELRGKELEEAVKRYLD